jgi:hypothetical protein
MGRGGCGIRCLSLDMAAVPGDLYSPARSRQPGGMALQVGMGAGGGTRRDEKQGRGWSHHGDAPADIK